MNYPVPGPQGLAALEARLADDLSLLELPAKSWVPERLVEGQRVLDVVLIGGGMCGLTAAAALRLLGVDNLLCLDRAPAGLEGPWETFARMETLRSPKQLTGPALGLPALTFRAWYRAQFGEAAWDQLDKIPKGQWMDYLRWYRRVLSLPVRNQTAVERIEPQADGLFRVEFRDTASGETGHYLARRVVLANGRDGLGGPWVPAWAHDLPAGRWAHSADEIDFAALRGKRLAVIGAGASAMDNAATALEQGAGSVSMLIRRADLPRVNKFTGIASQGVVHGFAALSDEWKWTFLLHTLNAQTPPPRDSTLRVSRHPAATFWLNSPVLHAEATEGGLCLHTPRRQHEVDFVIFATGFRLDFSRKPELAAFAPHIRLWRDVHTVEPERQSEELATSPYLGNGFEFTEREPGSCPALRHLYCFNYPSTLSHGKLSGDIPAVSDGARRLAQAIVASLFTEDRELHYRALVAYDKAELQGDEWQDAGAAGGNDGRA
ncbi:NAD(P)-binding domain-containing protein [Nissabacter sp. SGAir0207]|uniref:NAD(P)-binding domain-containing protein n=1 Tax=Nissabacter sp. SGAir0207 TaxID=2126321 RepID=UPI0010CD5922|nr:NAD(P)/FAD-dependent oxidoreductase [Nissabacter sp. SGAir0207]QCR38427.1 FAD-dependent oxidoreductase [Nissabacter sp. SGAir0207]